MKWVKQNSEVLYPNEGDILGIAKSDIVDLLQVASENDRQRARYCAHGSIEDAVHEMFIYHRKGAYIRPHKHLGKAESFHLIEGEAYVVFFDEKGNIVNVLSLGSYESGKTFYYRLPGSVYHTQIFSEDTVFHETTRGPLEKQNTIFPEWAPPEEEDALVCEYVKKLKLQLQSKYSEPR